jgi:hypothetical protein
MTLTWRRVEKATGAWQRRKNTGRDERGWTIAPRPLDTAGR